MLRTVRSLALKLLPFLLLLVGPCGEGPKGVGY